jgi:site-specific recombinase XerD
MKLSMRMFKKENGYYYYEIERNKKRSLRTKDKREAKRLYNIIKKEVLKGRLVQLDGDKRITLSEFKDVFFERHTDIDDDTIAAYDLAYRLFIDSTGGSTLLSRISEKHIAKFKTDCLARGCRKTSVNTYLRHLRGILNKAFEWGNIKNKIKIKFYKIPKRHPRILSKSEIDSILEYTKKHDPEMYRIIVFALWTGARREEIHTFVWQNVYGTTARLIGKGDTERSIPLLPDALEAMGEKKDVGPIFAQWHLDTYTHKFKKIARRFGVEDVHFHHLRHTAATQMIESGIELSYVQGMLGHSAISTTQIYTAIVQKTLEEKMKKMRY